MLAVAHGLLSRRSSRRLMCGRQFRLVCLRLHELCARAVQTASRYYAQRIVVEPGGDVSCILAGFHYVVILHGYAHSCWRTGIGMQYNAMDVFQIVSFVCNVR